ncbi:MAG TPA: hypothetical protein VGM53_18220 [Streptosporangiaceae bacterium]
MAFNKRHDRPLSHAAGAQARHQAGQRVALDHPPPGWQLTGPPAGLAQPGPGEPADVIISFVTSQHELAARLPGLAGRIYPGGALWVAWPRRAAGHRSDITDNVIREHALPLGVVDVKVAAIDTDWSGLRLVWRVSWRGGRPPDG